MRKHIELLTTVLYEKYNVIIAKSIDEYGNIEFEDAFIESIEQNCEPGIRGKTPFSAKQFHGMSGMAEVRRKDGYVVWIPRLIYADSSGSNHILHLYEYM